jgi:hypothetical protein
MKNAKRVMAILIAFALVFSLSATAAANTGSQMQSNISIEPFSQTTTMIDLALSYSGTTISCSSVIRGQPNVNRIVATYTLRRVNANGTTTTVRTWSNLTSNTRTLTFTGTFSPVSRGQTYRLDLVATVTTTSGVTETVRGSITRTY